MQFYDENNIFKGYIETKKKKSIEKFKDKTDFKSFEQAKNLPEFAGVLMENIVLIDIDDKEQSEILFDIVKKEQLNCAIMETQRGKHFYFKNTNFGKNWTKTNLAIGIQADIKLGSKNSYAVLKVDVELRPVIYYTDEIGEVPVWLTPIKSVPEFLNMEAGDGRNQSLFNYILALQTAGLTEEEIKDTHKIINKYILKEPLSEQELKTILRSEAFKKQAFFKGNSFLHAKFGDWIKNDRHIIKIDSKLHIYKDGVYTYGNGEIEREMIRTIPILTDAKRKETLKYLNIMCDETLPSDASLIAFRNGIYDIKTDSLIPFSPDVVITNKINWDYNPNAYHELADKTLNKIACQDEEIRMLLEEIIGYCFYRKNKLGKAFILVGDASNGKSTFISLINKILGNDNVSSLDLKNLGDRFGKATLYKKLANLGDDIGEDFVSDPSLFKKIVTGDRIQAEEKGEPPFEFNPCCKLIFSANVIPRIRDKTEAVTRRLITVPFDAIFSEDNEDFDPDIKYKLQGQESIEYLIMLAIQGLKRVLKNKKFTKSVKAKQELEEYKKRNNPILAFIEESKTEDSQIENEPTKEVYGRYRSYCFANGFEPLSHGEFSKQICRILDFHPEQKWVNGKNHKVYKKNLADSS